MRLSEDGVLALKGPKGGVSRAEAGPLHAGHIPFPIIVQRVFQQQPVMTASWRPAFSRRG